MKKREFQQCAAAALLKKIADVNAKVSTNKKINPNNRSCFAPNIEVQSKSLNTYFKLRNSSYQWVNLIGIAVKQTGELSYRLTDELKNTNGDIIYYQYGEADDHETVIKKFADDMGRLYKDFLNAGAFYGYYDIKLAYDIQADDALKEYEKCIKAGCL